MKVVETHQLSKVYKHFTLHPVSLSLEAGYITGLIGPNGSGKSTFIRLLTGLCLPTGGEVQLFGKRIRQHSADLKERIGYVFDESPFYEHLTIQSLHRIVRAFYRRWDAALFLQYLDRFELSPKFKIRNLSKGMKMKLSLAVALSHHAELLIMDEPTAGLDPVFRREILDLLAERMIQEPLSVLFSTHITTDLDRIADYIAFLNRGRLVFCESRESIGDRYGLVKADRSLLDADTRQLFVGIRETSVGFEGLTANWPEARQLFGSDARYDRASLEDIMYFTVKGGSSHAGTRA